LIPVLTGPTGAGKTSVVLQYLDDNPDVPVISADSRQIYKYLNIGTDKPSGEICKRFNIHLVDFVIPGVRYTAFDFIEDAEKLIGGYLDSKVIPIICGGTGLYIKSLVEGIVEIPEDGFSIRQNLENEAAEKGPKYLFEKLEKIDPVEAKKVHPHNLKRLIRALEIYYITGRPKSEIIASSATRNKSYDFRILCLLPPRENLYQKINQRVDKMVEQGLLDEVRNLHKLGLYESVKKVNVIGYNEIFRYLEGNLSLEAAINLLKQNTRRFAKRQITWFRGMDNIEFVASHEEALISLKNVHVEAQKIFA